jgi:hypothetical protein
MPQLQTRFAQAFLSERRDPIISRVLQYFPDGRAVPTSLPPRARNSLLLQATHHLAQRQAIAPDPREHLLHHAGLLGDDQ